jgi:chitinase
LKNSLLFLLGSHVAYTMANSPFCPTANRRAIYMSFSNLNYNDFAQTVMSASDSGYNVLIMSFYVVSSHAAFDSATLWAGLGAGQQDALNYVHNAGGCVLLSVGGATDVPYTLDPTSVGNEVAAYATANNYDGVDFDMENFQAGFVYNGIDLVSWLTTVTNTVRDTIGSEQTITHAPQSPYFGTIGGNDWTGPSGGYSAVEQRSSIDWYNVQFYNQGPQCYVDYTGLFVESDISCPVFPHTSVSEIAAGAGMSVNKVVVGKPITTADAGSGFLDAGTFGDLLRQAISSGINHGGYMGWKWEVEAQTWNSQIGSVVTTDAAFNSGFVHNPANGSASSKNVSSSMTSTLSYVGIGFVAFGVVAGLALFALRKYRQRKDDASTELPLSVPTSGDHGDDGDHYVELQHKI